MKWYGISIQTRHSISHFILGAFAFLAGAVGTMSFVAEPAYKDRAPVDTTHDKYGFQSLFIANKFDASKPYINQLNPQAISFVQEYIRKQGKELDRMKSWGKPYFDLYDNILAMYGIPKEMKYLSVIESHLQPGLVSWAGAVGPWQLMDYEAKRYGLNVGLHDDRMDFYKSTHVAAKLMKELYAEFGDWLLVVAAYNGGAGRVRQCIKKSGSRDFWVLQYYLKEETRTHVKKFIATHYVFEGSGGWTTLTADETQKVKAAQITDNKQVNLSNEELESTTTLNLTGRYNALVISNSLVLEINQFNKWNPGLEKALAEGKPYSMRIPKDKVAVFESKKNQILMESYRLLIEGKTVSK